MKIRISNWRLITLFSWLAFINMMVFGVPHFSTLGWAQYLAWPNLSSRFFVNNPTSCQLYMLQAGIVSGHADYFLPIIIPLMIFVLFIIVLGRFWCAWLCPIYLIQDLLTRFRTRLNVSHTELSPNKVSFLNRTKYAFLFLLTLGGAVSVVSALPNCLRADAALSCEVCPSRSICIFGQQTIGVETWATKIPITSIFVGVIFFASFKVRNFWCRICPLGAMMAPLNSSALLHIEKDHDKCTKCRICKRVCPMDIDEIWSEDEKVNVTHESCVHCYRCVEECPEEGCLKVKFVNRTMLESHSPWKDASEGGKKA